MSPFSIVRQLMDDMDRMLGDFGNGTRGAAGPRTGVLPAVWAPAIEAFEKEGRFIVRADLPGLSPEDVRIEASDGALTIEGERRSKMEAEEEGGVYRSERVYGCFSRTIALPDGANVDDAKTKFENGVLELSMPVAADATRRRRIEIERAAKSHGRTQEKESGQPALP